jgi:hypothetical protein
MIQKYLGIVQGFLEKSAAVLLAQYAAGAQTPKAEFLCLSLVGRGRSPGLHRIIRRKRELTDE